MSTTLYSRFKLEWCNTFEEHTTQRQNCIRDLLPMHFVLPKVLPQLNPNHK